MLQLEAGYFHACAITARILLCWGNNQFRQATVPRQFHRAAQVAAYNHTCAVLEGTAGCWGRDN